MRNSPNALMIFAAGFGTRMGDLTKDHPKPLVPVAGRALLDHALDCAEKVPLSTTVVNTHYRADQIRTHLAHRPAIKVSDEQPDILETGGGLKAALPLLGPGPVLTMNSDAIFAGPNPLRLLLDAWRPNEMDALLLLVDRENALGHKGTGDFIVAPDGRLTRGPGDIFVGAQICKTDRLSEISDIVFSLNVLWDAIAKESGLFGVRYPGRWVDVGTPKGIALAEAVLADA